MEPSTDESRPEFSVKDGVRTLKFDGIKLSESSSRYPGKPRWVEFELYRTTKGQYVVSRIGFSLFFHSEGCFTVARNGLKELDGLRLLPEYTACDKCNPSRVPDKVYPETPRHAGWVCGDAVGVVSSLMQQDDNKTEYLTNVARRLLIDAAKLDRDIADAFYVDRIE